LANYKKILTASTV